MSNRFHGNVKAAATSVSLPVLLTKTADGTEQTGTVAADVTASYWRQGGVRVAVSVTDLAAVNSAFSGGGWKEVDGTNQPGIYRFDVPDAAAAAGADWVIISVKVAGCYVSHERLSLETAGSSEVMSVLPAANTAAGSSGGLPVIGSAPLTNLDAAVSAVKAKTDNLPASPASTTNITAGVITTATNLTNLPAIPTDWLTAAGVKADAVAKIQAGLATPTNITAGTLTTVTNLTNAPAAGDFTAAMKASLNAATVATNPVTLAATQPNYAPLTTLGSAAPAGWLNTAAFAAGATLPVVTTLTNFPAPAESLTGAVTAATTTSVTLAATGATVFNATANAYATAAPPRYLTFTAGANRGLCVTVTGSSYSAPNLTLTFAASAGVGAASAGDTVQVD